MKAPTNAEFTQLARILALRIGRYVEWQGWLTRDVENGYLAGDGPEAAPMGEPKPK